MSPDDGSPDPSVQFSVIQGSGYGNLEENERVEFRGSAARKRPMSADSDRRSYTIVAVKPDRNLRW
ncbi:hypothetical protein ACIRU3_46570 [Streptomyces sp. NPDC101151]|uniref:hypothetical protein n=1 Tax=Streptomyces sp. NPDC101151 TaxID=3366115 RepID=UPI0038127727